MMTAEIVETCANAGPEPPVPVPPQFTSPPPLVPIVPAPGMPGKQAFDF
jgi:hypothetical protein